MWQFFSATHYYPTTYTDNSQILWKTTHWIKKTYLFQHQKRLNKISNTVGYRLSKGHTEQDHIYKKETARSIYWIIEVLKRIRIRKYMNKKIRYLDQRNTAIE